MLDRKDNIYEIGNKLEVNRKNFMINLDKPYIIVCGTIGIGKSAYINVMRKFNMGIQYLEVQNINTVNSYVRRMAKEIIEIKRLY